MNPNVKMFDACKKRFQCHIEVEIQTDLFSNSIESFQNNNDTKSGSGQSTQANY